MLFGESIIFPAPTGSGGANESYEVALVPEKDLAVDGRDDEKLLLRSLRNMADGCVCACVLNSDLKSLTLTGRLTYIVWYTLLSICEKDGQ